MSVKSNAGDATPIFIHSSFRTSSTWLWNKFRGSPSLVAYCEIFHESLATIDAKQAASVGYASWISNHPESAPYFLEYLPLIETGGGVTGYETNMAFEKYIPRNGIKGELENGEVVYIERLIRNACDCHKIPVLTDCRTLGRVHAFKKAFSGKTIILHRNLFHQWASYSSQSLSGNNYFIETIQKIIETSTHDAFVRLLKDCFPNAISAPDDEQMFQVFLLLHIYLYAHALEDCDIELDLSMLAYDSEYRSSVERDISEMICSEISLADISLEFERSVFSVGSKVAFRDTIIQFCKLIERTGLSSKGIAAVQKMRDSALQEWDRHEFYTKRVRSIVAEQSNQLKHETESNQKSLADASSMNEQLQLLVTKLASERDILATQLAQLSDKYDNLKQSYSLMADEKEKLESAIGSGRAKNAAE